MSEPESQEFVDPMAELPDLPQGMDDSMIFRSLVPQMESADDVQRYQMADAFAKALEAQRKEQSRRMADVVRAWGRHKSQMRESLMGVLQRAGGKVSTLIGTTFVQKKTAWGVEIEDEAAVIAWLRGSHENVPRDPNKASAFIEIKEVLSQAGKDFVREFVEKQTSLTGVVPPGVKVSPPEPVVATRARGAISFANLDRSGFRALENQLAKSAEASQPVAAVEMFENPFEEKS